MASTVTVGPPEVVNLLVNGATLGNAVLTGPDAVDYAGRQWRRLTVNTHAHGSRWNVNYSDLEAGAKYRIVASFANDGTKPARVSVDWVDAGGGETFTVEPGEVVNKVFGPWGGTYSTIFRFFDAALLNITDVNYSNAVLLTDIAIFREQDPFQFFDGNSPPDDGYIFQWSGAPHQSTSEKRKLIFTFTPDQIAYTEDQYRAKYIEPQVKAIRRVEILESDGSTIWEGVSDEPRLIAGSISIDYSRDERRSLDIELANFDKKLMHQPGGFWYDKVIKVYRGIEFRDREGIKSHEVPLGKFMIDRTARARFPMTVKITARDYTKKAMLSKLGSTLSFAKGTSITLIVSSLAANSGIFDRILPATDEVLGTDLVFERGTTRWAVMKQVADAFSYELFFDAQGYLVMRKYIDPTLGPIAHDFLTGPSVGNLVDWGQSTNDTRLFNHVIVTGTQDNGLPIRADAINDHPGSPTAVSKIGDRVMPFDSSIVTSQPQADELAATLLSVNALEEYEVNISSLVTPWLEAGEIFRFTDPDAPTVDPDRFLMTTITVPIGLEAMTAVGRRVTIVGGDY